MRTLTTFILLLTFTIAFANPNNSTSGDCSGVATNGGTVNTICTFVTSKKTVASHNRTLMVSEAWLTPAPGFMSLDVDQHLMELAALTTVVRNLTNEPIVVNAARIDILGHSSIKKKGGYWGRNILQPTIGDTAPIVIPPGNKATIVLGETLSLKGIIEAIEEEDNLDNAFVFDGEVPLRVNGKDYVRRFGELLEQHYGKTTRLRVTYLSGDYQIVGQIVIPLTNGTDLFYHGETVDEKSGRVSYRPLLAYDAFLGEYLKAKEKWVPGFRIRETPVRCIEVTPNDNIPGGLSYHDAECVPKKKD